MTALKPAKPPAIEWRPTPSSRLPEGLRDPEEALIVCKSVGHPEVSSKLQHSSIEEVTDEIRSWWGRRHGMRTFGARIILRHLETLPGDTWIERWNEFEQLTPSDWRLYLNGEDNRPSRRHSLAAGIGSLLILDVVRPSYQWLQRQGLNIFLQVPEFRDPEAFTEFRHHLDERGMTPRFSQATIGFLSKLLIHTGKTIRQLDREDLLEVLRYQESTRQRYQPLQATWRILHAMGQIPAEEPMAPTRRDPRLSIEHMVDYYSVPEPHRTMLVAYLRNRSATLDYNSLRNLAGRLANGFVNPVLRLQPDLEYLQLHPATVTEWKRQLAESRSANGSLYWHIMFSVKAMYGDVSSWALDDPFWVPWVGHSPVTRAEVRGYEKARRGTTNRMQDRTRSLAPRMPEYMKFVENRRLEKKKLLEDCQNRLSETITVDGEIYQVVRISESSPIRLRPVNGGKERKPETEEEEAFWTWAIANTLRLTGLRCEELLELTHFSIQPYRDPQTREAYPLVHIAPSKTDTERLLVASPELVHVLAEVVSRGRGTKREIPLAQRWDTYTHSISEPLPFLFARDLNRDRSVFSVGHVRDLLNRAAAESGIVINGKPMTVSTHDFRRIFATDALSSGVPPHIIQSLLGHKSISTTQGYAAIYPKDVIRHHRSYLAQRRAVRPSIEYREPKASEAGSLDEYFERRRVSLGSCVRAFGTSCAHEHACIRCSLLAVDSSQAPRLQMIIENLHSRIQEADSAGWVEEAEGLRISLEAAQQKLSKIPLGSSSRASDIVLLGMPGGPS